MYRSKKEKKKDRENRWRHPKGCSWPFGFLMAGGGDARVGHKIPGFEGYHLYTPQSNFCFSIC